ncbi:hypothetical protein ACFZAE_13735 [Streptomyces scabiei]|uniref:Mu transposase domain-containing protein n=1 Tax=Streptomyces scabiei TaxID=1930 RepID=UPI0036E806E4
MTSRPAYWRGSGRVGSVRYDNLSYAVAQGIDECDVEDDRRRLGARPRTVGEYFAAEQPLLKPLPPEPFETGHWSNPRVDLYGQVSVRTNRYLVPVRLIGR